MALGLGVVNPDTQSTKPTGKDSTVNAGCFNFLFEQGQFA